MTFSFAYGQQLRLVEDHYVESGNLYSRGYFLTLDSSTETSFGPWAFWYESGQIKLETFEMQSGYEAIRYINFWTEEGEQLLMNGNGILIEEFIDQIQDSSIYLIKDSLKEGYSWTYRLSNNGQMFLFKKAHFTAGKQAGLTFYFYNSGETLRKITFENGKESGYDIGYYKNGKIKEIGISKSYNKEGIWSYFDSLGNLQREEYYHTNYLKKFIDYYPNCCKKLEGQYVIVKNNQKESQKGVQISPHKRSVAKRISKFKSLKDGIWVYYNENCKVVRKINFRNKRRKNGM